MKDVAVADVVGIFETELGALTALYEEKAACYSSPTNALKNFDDQTLLNGMTPFQVWSVFALKHDIAIMNAIQANPSLPIDKSEGIRSRIRDRVVYSILFLALLDRAESKVADEEYNKRNIDDADRISDAAIKDLKNAVEGR